MDIKLRPGLELSKHSIKVKYYNCSEMIPMILELVLNSKYGKYTLDKCIKLYTVLNVRNHAGL